MAPYKSELTNKNKKLLTNRKKLCIIVEQTKKQRFATVFKRRFCGSTQEAVRGVPAKDVGRVSGAEVRIFSPTPNKKDRFMPVLFVWRGREIELTFVALPRMKFASVTKGVWVLAHKRLGTTRCHRQRIFSPRHCFYFTTGFMLFIYQKRAGFRILPSSCVVSNLKHFLVNCHLLCRSTL